MKFANTIAEEYLVSALLNSPEASFSHLKGEGISQDSFHNFAPKLLWNKCKQMIEAGRIHEVELLEVSDDVTGRPDGDEMAANISRIRGLYCGKQFLDQHIKTVKQDEARRNGYILASQVLQALDAGEDPQEVASSLRTASEAMQGILASQADWKDTAKGCEEFTDMLVRIHQEKQGAGIPTGISLIDHLTGGLRANELWVIAAPTSGGKTVLMLQMLANVLKLGHKAVVFSLETDVDRLHTRMVANTQNIPMSRLLGNSGETCTKDDFRKIKAYIQEAKEADNMVVCDGDSLSIESIEAKLAQIKDSGRDFDCVVVDYIQLVEVQDAKDLVRHEQIAKVTRRLKQIAKKYQIPVITASQINDDGRLRESRAIGHDADAVFMIDPDSGTIGVAKNRNGAKGDRLPLVMNGTYQRFE